MSVTEEEHDIARSAARLSSLLKEYTKKLRDICALAREVQNRHEEATQARRPRDVKRVELDFQAVRFAFLRLSPAANDLARQASQMVQHVKLEIVARLELSLRAAEFEAALQEAQQRINAGPQG